MAETIIAIVGKEPIEKYFTITDRTEETLRQILSSIQVYEFDTAEEAEAFRFGVCAVTTPSARDFCELSQEGYKNLRNLEKELHNGV